MLRWAGVPDRVAEDNDRALGPKAQLHASAVLLDGSGEGDRCARSRRARAAGAPAAREDRASSPMPSCSKPNFAQPPQPGQEAAMLSPTRAGLAKPAGRRACFSAGAPCSAPALGHGREAGADLRHACCETPSRTDDVDAMKCAHYAYRPTTAACSTRRWSLIERLPLRPKRKSPHVIDSWLGAVTALRPPWPVQAGTAPEPSAKQPRPRNRRPPGRGAVGCEPRQRAEAAAVFEARGAKKDRRKNKTLLDTAMSAAAAHETHRQPGAGRVTAGMLPCHLLERWPAARLCVCAGTPPACAPGAAPRTTAPQRD